MSSSVTDNERTERLLVKSFVLASVVTVLMLLLVARLFWLQVLQNKYYQGAAEENSTRVTFLRAPRGSIYDRHGTLLATNKQSISMIVIPNQLEHLEETSRRLSSLQVQRG